MGLTITHVEQSCRVCITHEGHCRYASLSPADIWNLIETGLMHISKSFDPVVRANIRRTILNLIWHYKRSEKRGCPICCPEIDPSCFATEASHQH